MIEKTLLNKFELWLSVIGIVLAVSASLTQIGNVFSADATELLKGITAGAALAAILAVISVFIGVRHPAAGFVLRFTAAFMLMLFFALVPGIGRMLALVGSISLLLSACLLLMRHLKATEARGISRM